jgi:hypothetical protein
MKYLITESQIDRIVFKYLDNQNFINIETSESIYFVYSEDDKYAQIRFDKKDGWCSVVPPLIGEVSSFFSMEYSDSMQVIGKWVENKLGMNVYYTDKTFGLFVFRN